MMPIGEIMAFISGSGTKSAARTLALGALFMTLTGNSPPPPITPTGEVDVHFEGLRSYKGMIRACLTRDPAFFPHCENDPKSYKASTNASASAVIRFADLTPGDYALTVLHDENQNFRADMLFGIPREGVGFSRNPVLRFGPPAFNAVRFAVTTTAAAQTVRMKYFL